ALPPVQGRAVHTLFRELDDDGCSHWPSFSADSGGDVSRHVWHLYDNGQAVCVECARLPGDAAGDWLLRVSHGTPEDAA
ncbi:hypothetical protein NK983_34550, partial [Salmonella enterica subsp. enterica serovar Typhimurium]|nr:hypothetical protein [Salmonella enterica subsp. enterica serovar Typhimurium]